MLDAVSEVDYHPDRKPDAGCNPCFCRKLQKHHDAKNCGQNRKHGIKRYLETIVLQILTASKRDDAERNERKCQQRADINQIGQLIQRNESAHQGNNDRYRSHAVFRCFGLLVDLAEKLRKQSIAPDRVDQP